MFYLFKKSSSKGSAYFSLYHKIKGDFIFHPFLAGFFCCLKCKELV